MELQFTHALRTLDKIFSEAVSSAKPGKNQEVSEMLLAAGAQDQTQAASATLTRPTGFTHTTFCAPPLLRVMVIPAFAVPRG